MFLAGYICSLESNLFIENTYIDDMHRALSAHVVGYDSKMRKLSQCTPKTLNHVHPVNLKRKTDIVSLKPRC
jgi:hypothetical protein